MKEETRQYKVFWGCVSKDPNMHESMYSFLSKSLSSHIWKFPYLGWFEANWLFHQKLNSNVLIVNQGPKITPTQDMISESVGLYFSRLVKQYGVGLETKISKSQLKTRAFDQSQTLIYTSFQNLHNFTPLTSSQHDTLDIIKDITSKLYIHFHSQSFRQGSLSVRNIQVSSDSSERNMVKFLDLQNVCHLSKITSCLSDITYQDTRIITSEWT